MTDYDRPMLKSLLACECTFALGEALMDRLLDGGEVLCARRNGLVSAVGDVDTDIHIVIEGIGRVWYDESNREITKYFCMPGTMLISFLPYYREQPQFYNFSAATPMKYMRIPRSHFNRLIEESHEFARWCLSMAHCQLYYYEYKDSIINGTARERYESLLKNRPQILREVPLNIISTYLRVTPQYLSKLRKETR